MSSAFSVGDCDKAKEGVRGAVKEACTGLRGRIRLDAGIKELHIQKHMCTKSLALSFKIITYTYYLYPGILKYQAGEIQSLCGSH